MLLEKRLLEKVRAVGIEVESFAGELERRVFFCKTSWVAGSVHVLETRLNIGLY